MSSKTHQLLNHQKKKNNQNQTNKQSNKPVTTPVFELTMLIELIPPKTACFACRNIQVSASLWLQGDAKSVYIALLLTTFLPLLQR